MNPILKKCTSLPKAHMFRVGAFEMTTLLAAMVTRPDPQSIFGTNVEEEEFRTVCRENFLPHDRTQFFYTPLLVNTGQTLILFDTGLEFTQTAGALADTGYRPEDVDLVVLTHMHGDHVGGLLQDGRPAWPNARIIAGQVEKDHWEALGSDAYVTNVAPVADKLTLIDDGDEIATGITALAAPGHTPGHMVFMFNSNGERFMHFADLANHYAFSLAHPDWEVRFDSDKGMASLTRRKFLGMLAEERILAAGYHMPFPAIGHVEKAGDGFRWVPVTYQTLLD